jgi:dynein heavy chain
VEFHDDLKVLYNETGCENKRVVFLFNETQLKEESFLEDMNNILSSGVVPNLFGKDEFGGIFDGVRKDGKAPTVRFVYINLVRNVRQDETSRE